ncbi:heterogeneous nuclear ribonucleoprotein A/B-like [Haliotis asinina]|uniref:heterogeneous nuclear ribonucleoprotein A/B-like n=1 Tax=Haliotis asinina TaxID=109174 RepID=UPI0035319DE1
MSGYQGYPQGRWPGGYDEGRAWASPANHPDVRYSEVNMANSVPMSRVIPGGGETYKRPAPYSREDFTGLPSAKRSHSGRGGLPVRGQGQESDWRSGMIDEADGSETFFVFNLMPNTTPSDLFQYFVKFGDLMKFDIFSNDEGKCTGTGIVQFVNEEAAVAALASEPHFILKKQVIVTHDQRDDPKTNLDVRKSLQKHKLFVTDIPLYVVEEDLCEYFSQWGNISFCDVEGRSNQRTRHIFVSYTNKEDALACLNTTHNYGESEINVLVATHCKALSDASKAGNNVPGSRFQTRLRSVIFLMAVCWSGSVPSRNWMTWTSKTSTPCIKDSKPTSRTHRQNSLGT